jgi:hypothetical protein
MTTTMMTMMMMITMVLAALEIPLSSSFMIFFRNTCGNNIQLMPLAATVTPPFRFAAVEPGKERLSFGDRCSIVSTFHIAQPTPLASHYCNISRVVTYFLQVSTAQRILLSRTSASSPGCVCAAFCL